MFLVVDRKWVLKCKCDDKDVYFVCYLSVFGWK